MPLKKAIEFGAQAEFEKKYPEIVSVYTVKDTKGSVLSREICTGPHVSRTSELGKFKIIKEESSAAGIRRIKAILE
jgi:alanyl-tRNA synthetase